MFLKNDKLFIITVIIPTIVSILYFGLIASDVYISESRFVVRSPQRQSAVGIGAILQGAGFSRSQDDSYSVRDYMLSRDAVQKLNTEIGIKKLYSANNIDIFSRFAGLGFDDSLEELYKYYIKHVSLDLDATSSITTLKVRAFKASDANHINEMLLNMGENLINKLNERGRQDMIQFATSEVAEAEKKAKAAAIALSAYRNNNVVFDPEKQSALQLQQISKLQDELIVTKTQLAQIKALTPLNPQIASLELRINTLQNEIKVEMSNVAGSNGSLMTKAASFERLTLERAFADKQLSVALASLEQARNDAQRKQLYLERIVQPSTPDVALEPKRLQGILATLILGLIAWGILKILIAGVREHHD